VNLLEMHCAPEFICCCAVYVVIGFVCGIAIGWRCGAQAGLRMSSEQAKQITERVKFLSELFQKLNKTTVHAETINEMVKQAKSPVNVPCAE
jgi:hypothetical protein